MVKKADKLSINEIRKRALLFSKKWAGESREHSEAQTFWNDFFKVFGKDRKRIAIFEKHVERYGKNKYIDCFWPNTLLCEHKSLGKNLDEAFNQALDYCDAINDEELPSYIIVCDFKNFRLYDMTTSDNNYKSFTLNEFSDNLNLFGFISGHHQEKYDEGDPVNIHAAKKVSQLHDFLQQNKYPVTDLDEYIPRLIFCLFAEDTGIFEKNLFLSYIVENTSSDGSDLGSKLEHLFEILDTNYDARSSELDEILNQFPYINGGLFKDKIQIPPSNAKIRNSLIELSKLDWSKISPAVFGSIFQSIIDQKKRRQGGIHYTSEANVKKVIDALFLNDLKDELNLILTYKEPTRMNKLKEFHDKIASLKFLEPACGCGNFLIITYKALRELETEILMELYGTKQQRFEIEKLSVIDVDSFYAIEIEKSSVKIAEVSMWIMDHLMNNELSHKLGYYYVRLPLKKTAQIKTGDALTINWKEVLPPSDNVYILGNPPFVGKGNRTENQKNGMDIVFNKEIEVNGKLKNKIKVKKYKELDYVAAWYMKAAEYIQNTKIKVGFVSTNSITQGQQATILWEPLMTNYDIHINFAHQTFQWNNEGKKTAKVHTIIIGFSTINNKDKILFKYKNLNGKEIPTEVKHINQYLLDQKSVFVHERTTPLNQNIPQIRFGSMPNGKGLILKDAEKKELITKEPSAEKFIRRYMGAEDFLHDKYNWCIWLVNANINEIKKSKLIMKRIDSVKEQRENSKRQDTQKLAETPTLFGFISQPKTDYILIPLNTSSKRNYIPIGFIDNNTIASNATSIIESNDKYLFGILSSKMHITWVQYVGGRLKNDYRYSNQLCYNTFPFPSNVTEKDKEVIRQIVQELLNIRKRFENTLDELYNKEVMPKELLNIHKKLDKYVDKLYGNSFKNSSERIKYLFNQYKELENKK